MKSVKTLILLLMISVFILNAQNNRIPDHYGIGNIIVVSFLRVILAY
jgi:hypothetical protein